MLVVLKCVQQLDNEWTLQPRQNISLRNDMRCLNQNLGRLCSASAAPGHAGKYGLCLGL